MTISKGDTVHWNTSQGETTGEAVEKKTEDFTFKGQDFKPTDNDPFWIVKSEKSGSEAAHKESALTKARAGSAGAKNPRSEDRDDPVQLSRSDRQ